MKSVSLIFSGKRGGGLTDLLNIVDGYVSCNSSTQINILTLWKFTSLTLISRQNITYKYVVEKRGGLLKEIFVNIINIMNIFLEIIRGKNILFTMTHPNLILFPIFRLVAFIFKSKLMYIRHNPKGFRHVNNYLHNTITVYADNIATIFCNDLLFFSKSVQKHFNIIGYQKKTRYIGFGKNRFSKEYSKKLTKEINFIFFGRCLPYKGLDVLLKALSKLKNKTNNNIIIASSGISDRYLEIIRHHSKNINIQVYNEWLDDCFLHELFSKSSCAILPYKEISQSGPILTSIGYKIPVICSNLDGIQEYLTHSVDSLHFKVNNSDELATCIDEFSINEELRNQLTSGMNNTSEKFSWKNVSLNIDKLIKNV